MWTIKESRMRVNGGKVPFYCTSWSNVASKANAIRCGYKTAWVEMTAKDLVL